jgi:myosin heavy subunit
VALKKPSDFYIKPEEKSSFDSLKEELSSSEPKKIEKISEAFSAFKSNLNHIQSLTDFSSTFESFKENVEKVETISNEIGNVKKEIQDIVNKISDDFSETSEMVNSFLDIEVPKYKNLIAESEFRIDNRFVNLKDSVEENLDTIRADVNKEVTTALSEVEVINQHSLSTIKNEVGDIANLVNENLPEYKKFFVETELRTEEKISEAQNIFDEKINFINQTYQERLEELNSTVKEFTNTEIPKYSKMLVESKLKSEQEVKELEKSVLKKVSDLTEQIENLYKVNNLKETDIDSLLEKVQTTVQESKNQTGEIFESYARLCKDSKKREVTEDKKLKAFSGRLENFAEKLEKIEETTVQDVLELQANLDISTSAYHDRLKKEVYKFEEELVEQIKDLEVNLTTNEVHIKKQNEHIENIKEEVQDVISKLHIDSIEEKNKALIEKVNHIEDVLSKFSEKALLTEDTPITPGSPDTKTNDPLTSLDQNYVTLKQLQDHYRLFINRIQVQLSSIGGGGAGFIKDLADVSFDESTGTNKLLIYNGTEWVGIASTAISGGGSSSELADDATGVNLTLTGNLSVGGTVTYDDVTHVDSIGIATARSGLEIGAGSITTLIKLDAATATTTTTSESNIDTFSASVFRSAQYQIQITRGSLYQVTTLNVLHDGTDVYLSEFGTIKTGSSLATFDADINSGNVRVRATPAFSSSTVFKISKTLTKV